MHIVPFGSFHKCLLNLAFHLNNRASERTSENEWSGSGEMIRCPAVIKYKHIIMGTYKKFFVVVKKHNFLSDTWFMGILCKAVNIHTHTRPLKIVFYEPFEILSLLSSCCCCLFEENITQYDMKRSPMMVHHYLVACSFKWPVHLVEYTFCHEWSENERE